MVTQSRLPAFLLTRPPEQSARFAQSLRDSLGPQASITISPLIAPTFLVPRLPDRRYCGLIFSSETAVQAFARLSQGGAWPRLAFCVGDQTARAARQSGFQSLSASGDADALIAFVQGHAPQGPLLHLRGEHSRGDIAGRLCAAGLQTDAAVVYRQHEQPLSATAMALLGRPCVVIAPLFSPRSALLFGRAGAQSAATVVPLALSDSVAAELPPDLARRARIAAFPNADDMLQLAVRVAKTGNWP